MRASEQVSAGAAASSGKRRVVCVWCRIGVRAVRRGAAKSEGGVGVAAPLKVGWCPAAQSEILPDALPPPPYK
jgi:hypothetical protein